MRRPTPHTQYPVGLQRLYGLSLEAQFGKEDRPNMDGSKDQPHMTAGLDLGDRYTHLCLIDTQSGEVIEEGRLRTSPEAFRRRFSSERSLRSHRGGDSLALGEQSA